MLWLIWVIVALLVVILVLLILPPSEWKALWQRLGGLRWPAGLGQSLRRRFSRVPRPAPGRAWRRLLRREQPPPDGSSRGWEDAARPEQSEESVWQERSRDVMRRMREEPAELEAPRDEIPIHRQTQPALRRSVLLVVVLIIVVALAISLWRFGTGTAGGGPPPRFTVLVANLEGGVEGQSSAELLAAVQQEFAAAGLPPTMTLRAVSDRPASADAALALARSKRADLLLWGRVRSDVIPGYVLTLTVLPAHHIMLAPEFPEYSAVMMTPAHFSLNQNRDQGLAQEDAARALAWVARFYTGRFDQLEDLPPAQARGAILSPQLFTFHWMSLLWLKGDYEGALQTEDELDCGTDFAPADAVLPPRQKEQRALCLAAANNRAVTLITQESLGQLPSSYLDEAAALLGPVVQAAPEATLARYNLGRAYLARGKWGDALVTLAKVVSQDTRNAAAWAALSEVSTEAGDYPRAKDAAEKAINLDRNLVTAYLAQGRYLLAIGRTQEAERTLQQALQLAGAEATRRRSLEAAQRVGPRANARRAEYTSAWAQRNNAVLARVHLTRARVFLRQGEVEGEPPFFVWLWRLIVGEMSPLEKANAEIQLALEAHPNWSAVLRIQAQLLLTQGKLEDAVVLLRELQEGDPNDLGTYLDLVAILRRQWRDLRRAGRTQEAEQKLADVRAEYQLLVDRGVAPALGYFGLGDVAQENGEPEVARQAFLKVVETDATYADAYLRLGQLDLAAGEEGAALDYFAQTLEVSGGKGTVVVAAHVERGDVFLEQYLRYKTVEWADRKELARSEYEAARKLDGRSVRALNGLGRIAYDEGDLGQAEGFLQQALAVSGGDFDANYNLGRVYEGRGQSSSAANYFRRALAARSGSIAAHYHLGIALYALLDEPQAQQNLEWVQNACPNLAQQKLPEADDVESCAGVAEWLKRVTEGK